MDTKFVQKGIRNVFRGEGALFSFALGPKTRSFSSLCTPATTHNEYLKQKDFYRIFHHRRVAPFMYVLAAAAVSLRCVFVASRCCRPDVGQLGGAGIFESASLKKVPPETLK